MSIHDGHRDRLRKRFCEEGLDSFTDVQVLELLLFYCIPRQDTNEIAHRLIDHFGSFAQVLDASPEELKKVPGIGGMTAAFLPLIKAAGRYYDVDKSKNTTFLNTIEDCGNYLLPFLSKQRNEVVYLLCLDSKRKVISCKEVGEGSVNSAAVPIRRIVEMALNANATSIVLGHNHPSGFAVPSEEDRFTTHRLAAALQAVDILLADHIVVADDEFVSMVQSGFYRPQEYSLMI